MKNIYWGHIIGAALTIVYGLYCIYSVMVGGSKVNYEIYYDIEEKFSSSYVFLAMVLFVVNTMIGLDIALKWEKIKLTFIVGGISFGIINILMILRPRYFDFYLMFGIHLIWFVTIIVLNLIVIRDGKDLFKPKVKTDDILDADD